MNGLKKFLEICKQNGIILAYLFGSQAQNGYKAITGERIVQEDPFADLDLGIILDNQEQLNASMYKLYSTLYNQLDELFLPLRLDLVFLQETHSVFQFEAIKGICLYAVSDSIQEKYEHNILARAADFRWVLEQYYKEKFEELGQA